MRSTLFLLLLLILAGGCGSKPQPSEPPPKWVTHPYKNGKTGAVGSAQIHFKGNSEQRKLAISRALDELAQQQGVEVSSQIARQDARDGMFVSSKSEIYSFQKNSGEIIYAHIEAVWKNPRTGELFIWMLKD